VATWIAFCVAVVLALPQPPDPFRVALGALLGAILVASGFFFASRTRTLPSRPPSQRTRLAVLSLLLGSVLGAFLLSLLVLAARAEPLLRARYAGRQYEPAWRPWALGFESSILEEVASRLFAMSFVAWIVLRLTHRSRLAFVIALVISTLLFGLAHLPAWAVVAKTTPMLVIGVILLNGIGGALLGWIWWRWGLPYAILCHLAGDVVIQSLAPKLLG